jgi:hypothetical protein
MKVDERRFFNAAGEQRTEVVGQKPTAAMPIASSAMPT